VEASLKKQGRSEKVVIIGGDGATFDIGMLCISGAFERGHGLHLHLLRQRGLHEYRRPAVGATPFAASTTTSPAGRCSTGNRLPKKDMPQILAAHGAPYVATASIAYPADFMQKVEKAVNTKGPCYVQVHAPCCTGWGFEGSQTMKIGKLAVETGLWVMYRNDRRKVTRVKKVVRKPVEEYLSTQKRFRHLFKPARRRRGDPQIQASADRNAEKYGHRYQLKNRNSTDSGRAPDPGATRFPGIRRSPHLFWRSRRLPWNHR